MNSIQASKKIESKANKFLKEQVKKYNDDFKKQSADYKPTPKEAKQLAKIEAKRIAKQFEVETRIKLDQEYAKKKELEKAERVIQQPSKVHPVIKIAFYAILIFYVFNTYLF